MEALVVEVNALRQQYRDVAAAHSQLLTQQNECTTELEILEDDAKIYKSTGPILTTQSKSDAMMTITKRMEYIAAELEKKSDAMTSLQKSIEDKCRKLDASSAQQNIARSN
ncbi:hypothetical protein BgAZ_401470 [Babesia gibsoni]|uniref:Prefoldin subunit 6 n=1 Tax=Babesia gibsoni TaxID=33632 RepID=A0AAD8LIC8_BABGI|nr:hypothetical protein BgAZ_401470 [Babesia gibsoni]